MRNNKDYLYFRIVVGCLALGSLILLENIGNFWKRFIIFLPIRKDDVVSGNKTGIVCNI